MRTFSHCFCLNPFRFSHFYPYKEYMDFLVDIASFFLLGLPKLRCCSYAHILFPFVWRLRILLKFSMCRHNVSILESPFKQFERLWLNIHQGNVDKMMKLCPVKAYSSLNWSVWTGFQRDLTPLNAFNNVGWYSYIKLASIFKVSH